MNTSSTILRTFLSPAVNLRYRYLGILIIAILLYILLPACTKHSGRRCFTWPSTGNPTVDSITYRLDYGFNTRLPFDSVESALNSLKEYCHQHPTPTLKARLALFQGWHRMREGEQAAADSIMRNAITELDSASHPYEYYRLDYMLDNEPTITPAQFMRITNRLKFFRQYGDDFMAAAMLTEMGNFLKNCRDTKGAASAYQEADSLYQSVGTPSISLFNRINRASLVSVERDTVKAIAIITDLLKSPEVIAKPDIKALAYEKMFLFTQDPAWLDSMECLSDVNPSIFGGVFRAQISFQEGKYSEAERLASQAYQEALEIEDYEIAALADYAWAQSLEAMGNKTLAYDRLKEAMDITEQIGDLKSMDDIRAMETLRQINDLRLEEEIRSSRNTMLWVWIGFGILLLIIGGAVTAILTIRNMKMRQISIKLEREKAHRKLIASSVMLEDKDRLLHQVEKHLSDLSDSPDSPTETPGKLSKSILLQQLSEHSREGLLEAYQELNPDFINRLKEIAPSLTQSDIRFACYISIGLDNKTIATTMGILHESVKQARWRLRKKLGLSTGDSLEDFLRSLV